MMALIDCKYNQSETAPERWRMYLDISLRKGDLANCDISRTPKTFEELVIKLVPAFDAKFIPELLAAAAAARLTK